MQAHPPLPATPFSLVFDAAPQPYLLLSADQPHTVVAVNARYLQLTGLQRDQLIGLPLLQTPAAHAADELVASLQRALDRRAADAMAPRYLPAGDAADGVDTRSHWWRTVHTPLADARDAAGFILQHLEPAYALQGVQADAAQLRDSACRRCVFAALLDNSSDFIGIADAGGTPVYVNPAGRKMVGLAPDYPVQRTRILDYYPEDLHRFVEDVILQSTSDNGHWTGETRFRHWRTGDAIPVSDEHFRIVDPESGDLLGLGTITRDISDMLRLRAQAEAANAESRRQYQKAHEQETRLAALSEHLGTERARLNDAQAVAHIGSWELDLRSNALSWSDEAYRIFGLDPQSTVASYAAFLERIHPDDRDCVDRTYRQALAERTPYSIEHRLVREDGSVRWVHEQGRSFYAEDGTPLRSIGTVQDITERKLADDRMRQSAAVFGATNQAIIVADAQARIVSVNPAFTRITGHAANDVVGCNPRMLSSGRHDRDFYQQMWRSIEQTGHWQGEIWNRRKNGEVYPSWQNISAVPDDNGRPSGYVSIFTDISEVKATEDRLAHLAHHDALTGLPNRVLFSANLDQSLEHARRQRRKVALLILDLDRFKLVNDTLGHTAGDDLLQKVAQRLRQAVRAEDTVARLGGDEFAIIAGDLELAHDAVPLAAKILDLLGAPVAIAGNELTISASVGIAIHPDDAGSSSDLVRAADAAMYRAKARGRATYAFYTSELSDQAAEALQIENDLRRAVGNGELVLHYQPQVDVRTLRIVGVEALLRWQHPQRGLLTPDGFIPLAEEGGQIDAIGDWVIGAALLQCQRWAADGLVVPRIGINISGRQVLHDQVGRSLSAAFARHGPMPEGVRLELEVTESALLSSDRCIGILQRLKDFGAHIAIDDFGTGYSSLSRLRQLPVDVLKIDRSFVHDLPAAADNAAIVTAIIAMGHSLGLRIVAEGVEHADQFEFMRALGCDEIQGHLLYPALPAAEMTLLLQQRAESDHQPP
jgi:diguanylate cyclase (GGDEF)-like protein/PAS domain S-box-containing protein